MSGLNHDRFSSYLVTRHSIKALEDWLDVAKGHYQKARDVLEDHDAKRVSLEQEMSRRQEVVNDITHAIQILKERLI